MPGRFGLDPGGRDWDLKVSLEVYCIRELLSRKIVGMKIQNCSVYIIRVLKFFLKRF